MLVLANLFGRRYIPAKFQETTVKFYQSKVKFYDSDNTKYLRSINSTIYDSAAIEFCEM